MYGFSPSRKTIPLSEVISVAAAGEPEPDGNLIDVLASLEAGHLHTQPVQVTWDKLNILIKLGI